METKIAVCLESLDMYNKYDKIVFCCDHKMKLSSVCITYSALIHI